MSEKMNDNFFNSIPKEKTLNHKVIGPKINKLIEFFINKIDREFPHDRIRNKNAKGMFLTFAYVAKNTYRSVLFLCDMVSKDPGRKIEYSISSIPLLRVILEEVFTMLFFSEKLDERITWYHKAGWRETKETYDRCLARYGEDENWASWFEKYRKHLNETTSMFGITSAEASNPRKNVHVWPTPGQMKKRVDSPNVTNFMQYLQDWFYKTFSQAAHLSWPGLAIMGGHFLHANLDNQESYLKKTRSDCAFYNTTLILAFFSELENILKFNHKEELKYLWTIVSEYWEVTKELYDKRYRSLLQ